VHIIFLYYCIHTYMKRSLQQLRPFRSRSGTPSPRRLSRKQSRSVASGAGAASGDAGGGVSRLERSINAALVGSSVALLDKVYEQPSLCYARFFTLETIARVPYFGALLAVSYTEQRLWLQPALAAGRTQQRSSAPVQRLLWAPPL